MESSPTNPSDSSSYSAPTELEERPRRLATLQERFTACFTDHLILVHLLGGWWLAVHKFMEGRWIPHLPIKQATLLLAGSTGAALYFLYYLFCEGVLTATPGKFLGQLSIEKKEGGAPSILAIVLRNLLRLVDTPLFFLTGLAFMEATEKRQRLGDLLARTVVTRKVPPSGRRLDPSQTAGATRRTFAFLLDLLLLLPFTYGLLLSIPMNRPSLSYLLLNLSPLLVLLYLSLAETFLQTTFGKALCGLKVVDEEGRPPTLASALLRNSFRLVDMNPAGYLCAALASRKQRPGDIVAGTLVVRARRGLRGWLAVPVMFALVGLVGGAGLKNRNSFVKKGYSLTIASEEVDLLPASLETAWHREFRIETIRFGFSEGTVNPSATFDPGNTIYLLLKLSGFDVRNGKAWLQADLKVKDSRKSVVLERINIVNASLSVGSARSADVAIRFALHPEALPGRYQTLLTLRDGFTQQKLVAVQPFTVRPTSN